MENVCKMRFGTIANPRDSILVDVSLDKLTDEENTAFNKQLDLIETSLEKLMLNVSDLELMQAEMSALKNLYRYELCSTKRRFIKRSCKKLLKRGNKQSKKIDILSVNLMETHIPHSELLIKFVGENKIFLDHSLLNRVKENLSIMNSTVEKYSQTIH